MTTMMFKRSATQIQSATRHSSEGRELVRPWTSIACLADRQPQEKISNVNSHNVLKRLNSDERIQANPRESNTIERHPALWLRWDFNGLPGELKLFQIARSQALINQA